MQILLDKLLDFWYHYVLLGGNMPYKTKLTPEELNYVLEQGKEGAGYSAIAQALNYKISKQRVKQICDKHKIDVFGIKQDKRQEILEEKMTNKWGKEWHNPSTRRSYLYQAMRAKFRTKRANSVRNGIEFTIDFGDLTFPTHCPVFGLELDYFTEQGWTDNAPSFDRVDSTKGYTKGNVVIISMRANRIKNNGTAEEHEKIAAFIRQHLT
jgi:hypothetical protein